MGSRAILGKNLTKTKKKPFRLLVSSKPWMDLAAVLTKYCAVHCTVPGIS